MVKKRNFPANGLDSDEVVSLESKRRPTFENAVRRVIRGLWTGELVSKLEPFIKRWVREEIEKAFQRYTDSSFRPLANQIEASGSRGWQLHFRNMLPGIFFTGNQIKADDETDIKIAILAANSDMIVTAGPLSSLKVEILVLKGDFGNDQEDWSEEAFDASVQCQREGKRPLLAGDLFVTLKDGVGFIRKITITDNSSWTRSGTFRLGARIVQGTFGADRVREARSGPFAVKDQRGQGYKKHYPPFPSDKVWRLEGISKDGVFHKLLSSNGINTVQDFQRNVVRNSPFLRDILGKGMSDNKWRAIVQHASSCVLDNKQYIYDKAEQQVKLLFDSIHNVVGASFDDGCSFLSLDSLSSYQMNLVESVKQLAYRNVDDMYEIACPMVYMPSTSLQGNSSQIPGFPVTDLDTAAPERSLNYATNSFSNSSPVEDARVRSYQPLQGSKNVEVGFLTSSFNDCREWIQDGSPLPAVLDATLKGDTISQLQFSNLSPSWEQDIGFFMDSGYERGVSLFPSLPEFAVSVAYAPKPNMGWFKLRAAFKSVVPFCHSLAARRARVPQFGY